MANKAVRLHRPDEPAIPPHLSGVARERWLELIPVLREQGTLSRADGPILEEYCWLYAELLKAKAKCDVGAVIKRGDSLTLNPYLEAVVKIETKIRPLLADLGLTRFRRMARKPSERPTEDTEAEPADPFAGLEIVA